MTAPLLAFNTEHGRHYAHPRSQVQVPSVSNITDKKYKPLFRAGLKAAARYTSDNLPRLRELTPEEVYKLVSDPPRLPNDPSILGDVVHEWINRYVKGNPPAEDEIKAAHQTARWMWAKFLAFVKHYSTKYPDFAFTDAEFTVWSNRYGYAGTADLSFHMNGAHVLCDNKTGKQPYPEVGMQVAAYANADVVLLPDGTEKPMPKFDKFAVLHIRPRSVTLHPLDHIDEAFQGFLALKTVYDWDTQFADKTIVASPRIN